MGLHKSIAKQWQLMSWAPTRVYNPTMGKAEYSAMTKGQDRNQKIVHLNKQSSTTGDAHRKLLRRVATELTLMVNGAPHPNLGNISSPRHEDHTEVWRHWARSVAKTLPMGIVPAADGFPHQRHIRGFCHLAPLMRNSHPSKTQSDDENHHQCMGSQMLMMLIALPGEYASLLVKHNIVITNQPSWEPIVFPPDTTLDHAAYLLAQAGLSVDEVGRGRRCLTLRFGVVSS